MAITDTLRKMGPKSAVSFFDQKLKYEIGPGELKEKMDHKHGDFQVVDVRTLAAYNQGHIPGAKSIPFQELGERMREFSEDKTNILYCYTITCQLSYKAARTLAEKGYPAKVLIGGFNEWEKSELPIEK